MPESTPCPLDLEKQGIYTVQGRRGGGGNIREKEMTKCLVHEAVMPGLDVILELTGSTVG